MFCFWNGYIVLTKFTFKIILKIFLVNITDMVPLSTFFFITQWIYYIYSCTMIITIQFYRISIPQPQCILQPPELSPLETISFSSLWVSICSAKKFSLSLFQIPHVSESIWCWCLIVWLTSLGMIISRSIHVAKNAGISFLLMTELLCRTDADSQTLKNLWSPEETVCGVGGCAWAVEWKSCETGLQWSLCNYRCDKFIE